ncbi:MAG: hypothetical protein H6Q25_1444 [Bacteroidetes bacterium]|nr:hypothetical protein [Bacteroidota bacterium]
MIINKLSKKRILHKMLHSDKKMQIKGVKWNIFFKKEKKINLYLSVYQFDHFIEEDQKILKKG